MTKNRRIHHLYPSSSHLHFNSNSKCSKYRNNKSKMPPRLNKRAKWANSRTRIFRLSAKSRICKTSLKTWKKRSMISRMSSQSKVMSIINKRINYKRCQKKRNTSSSRIKKQMQGCKSCHLLLIVRKIRSRC